MEGPQWSRDHPGQAGGLGFLITDRELVGMLPWRHQEERGLFLLVFPNCLNSSGFHMLAQMGLDKPAVGLSQCRDKCHQGPGSLQLILKAWERLCISQET